jgi:acyl carrier protein
MDDPAGYLIRKGGARRTRLVALQLTPCIMTNGRPSTFLGYMSDKASPLRQPAPPADNSILQLEIAELIVAALNLDVAAADIDPQAPLYGDGLGLDSIDILEIAPVVSKQYGIQLRADSEENEQIFRSLRHLADYITAHRTK